MQFWFQKADFKIEMKIQMALQMYNLKEKTEVIR